VERSIASTEPVLLLTERFHPEEFLVNDLALSWKKQGLDVEVLTQAPSYPFDRIFAGYKNTSKTESWAGIPVHRVTTVLGYSKSVRKKIIGYVSFAAKTSTWAVVHGHKYKHVFVCHTGPLTMATAVLPLRWIYGARCTIWTQDVWPDTVYAYGIKPTWWRKTALDLFVSSIYRSCAEVAGSCPGFGSMLSKYTSSKVQFIPQWFPLASPPPSPFPPPSPVVFTFAGNLGSVQNLDRLVQLFSKAKVPDAVLRIIGDGVMMGPLRKQIDGDELSNVQLLGRRPLDEMPQAFADSHVLIISLKKDPVFALTIPAKFQAYLTAGRPLLAIADGELAQIVASEGIGVAADPDDDQQIVAAFRELAEKARLEKLSHYGHRAQQLTSEKFSRTRSIQQLLDLVFS